LRPTRPLLLVAPDLAVAHDISAYDAAHLALAEAADAMLITLDLRVARVAGARSLVRPRPGAIPARASNGRVAGAPDWARHSRYLAELRRTTGA
jgi:hypothetical protein